MSLYPRPHRFPLRALPLEERALPSQSPVGPLLRPYTFTEVMASIRAEDPLTGLGRWVATNSELNEQIDVVGSRVILRNGADALVEVRLQVGADPLSVLEQLQAQPDVMWTEPNYIYVGDPRDYTPNDPQFASQYHHMLMQNNKAWDTQTGNPSIVLAILDDGIAINHPDFGPTLWTNTKETPGNSIDDDSNGFVDDVNGWDIASGDNNPNPLSSDTHGTHVSGIAAARTDNATGVSGVAGGGPNGDGIRLMPVRWYGSGSWTASVVAQSYAYAADNGAKVVNASYAFDGWAPGGVANSTVWNGLEYAYSKGLLLMNSAGNNGELDPTRGVFDQVLFVANTTSSDTRSSSSNYGWFVDVSSPGSSILATTTNTGGTVFTYGNLSGTSMSTPNAAAVAGLIWSQNPDWTRDQVAAQLIATADSIDSKNPLNVDQLGTGRTNSYRGVTELIAPPKFGTMKGLPAFNGSIDRMPTSFSLRSPFRFDPATVSGDRFDLRGDGPDNLFDTSDDVVIPLTVNGGVSYRIGVGQFDFVTSDSAPADRYRLKASAALLDPMGRALDGNGNGVGGDDYQHIFFITRQVDGFVFEDRDGDGSRDQSEPGLANRVVYLDTDNDLTFDSAISNYSAIDLPKSILDNATASSTIGVTGFVGIVTDVNVTLSLTHQFDGDLSGYLVGPTGTKIELFSGVGGSGQNFVSTKFDDQASVSIVDGAAPFTGSFRPEIPLAGFNKLNPNGVWTLQIVDGATNDTGTFNSWSLEVTTSEPVAYTDANGLYTFNGLANGTFNLRHVTPAGWNEGSQPIGGSHEITIAGAGVQAANRDFAELRVNAIYGRIYDDVNHSGTFSAGEAPLSGWTAFLDANGNGKYDSLQKATASTNVPLAIPDLTAKTSTLTFGGSVGLITDVNVKLSISHTSDAHLDVFLISPSGKSVQLFTDVGGTGDNFTNTTLDDQAATAITTGTAPFSGTYRPEGKLSDFNGLNSDGVWTLQITDDTSGTTGTLTSWSVIITTAETSTVSGTDGTYVFSSLAPGSYTVNRTVLAGYTATHPTSGFYALTVASGDSITQRDFGQTKAPLPPKVTQVKIDDDTVQRSMIRSLQITFSDPVTLPANKSDAFLLERVVDSAPVIVEVQETGNVVTLTFVGGAVDGGSLADGRYSLTILADQLGSVFDGNGDGKGGDNYLLTSTSHPAAPTNIYRLFGDSDGNGVVSASDFAMFRSVFGTSSPSFFDFDGNDLINAVDFDQFRSRFGVGI